MKRIFLLSILVVLACGTPYIANTPNANTAAPNQPTPAPIRLVTGCWNIRETPGGTVVGGVCNTAIKVYGLVDGWMQVDGGYICPRAFGDKAECEVEK